jgi:hypothetical protein
MATRLRRLGQLFEAASQVRARTGKPLRRQLDEIIALRRGAGRVGASWYYAWHLFDDARYTPEQREEFVRWDWEEVGGRLNRSTAASICDDKLITDACLRGFGLPVPGVVAVYHPAGRRHGSVPSFTRLDDLAAFLRSTDAYPLFGKPVRDRQGGGASSLDAYDPATDRLRFPRGQSMGVDEYVRDVPGRWYAGSVDRDEAHPAGYFFQRRIGAHPALEELGGGRAVTYRLLVFLRPDGPRVFRGLLNVATGNRVTGHGIAGTGNLNCLVDVDTGMVTHAIRMRGEDEPADSPLALIGAATVIHPDTGRRVLGLRLPLWEQSVALCRRVAPMLPEVLFQSWDVIPAPDGPVLLELNRKGGYAQLPGGPGFNDAEFRAFRAAWERA